jgi:hypothetical protein
MFFTVGKPDSQRLVFANGTGALRTLLQRIGYSKPEICQARILNSGFNAQGDSFGIILRRTKEFCFCLDIFVFRVLLLPLLMVSNFMPSCDAVLYLKSVY